MAMKVVQIHSKLWITTEHPTGHASKGDSQYIDFIVGNAKYDASALQYQPFKHLLISQCICDVGGLVQ